MACQGLTGIAGWLCEHDLFPFGTLRVVTTGRLCQHGFHRWETLQAHNVRSKVGSSWATVTFSQRCQRCRRCGVEQVVTASPTVLN